MSAITAETEAQLEQELEHESAPERAAQELAQELGAAEYEVPEWAAESETEYEHEHEFEYEFGPPPGGGADREQASFFNHLAAMADRGGRSQALRRVALSAARAALRRYRTDPPIIEGEMESLGEGAPELEFTVTPASPGQAVALMEHLAHAAAAAETEQEAAEQFLPLIPLAAKAVLPVAARALPGLARKVVPGLVKRVTPALTRGVARITRTLFRSPVTRPLVRAVPSIARRTVAHLARRFAAGRPMTARSALGTLARQTARTLGHPRIAANAFRRSRRLDARYHQALRRVVGGPTRSSPVRGFGVGGPRQFGSPGPVRTPVSRRSVGRGFAPPPPGPASSGVMAAAACPTCGSWVWRQPIVPRCPTCGR